MFAKLKRISSNLIQKSTSIQHEPLNKVSIVILLLVDFFVIFNVFSGLNSISDWPLSPSSEFPCFSAYQNYQMAENKGSLAFKATTIENLSYQNKIYPPQPVDNSPRLGQVSNLCNDYTRLSKAVNNTESVQLKNSIDRLRNESSYLSQEIRTLESQYNSTLLEKIAGQAPDKSINKVNADRVKSEIERRQNKIADNQKQIIAQQTKLIQLPASDAYLKLLDNTAEYQAIEKAYQSAEFWYPNQQLLLQALFILPLIIIAYLWHSTAVRKDFGLQALLSWHLLLIFCIPLILKVFEFIQFSNLVQIVVKSIIDLLGGLLFVASYTLILVIPLVGFGLIKLLQVWVFNPRVQAKKRIQKVRCINCNSKLRLSDEYCPHCGFYQYVDCANCHQKTYKFTNYCSRCGHKIKDKP